MDLPLLLHDIQHNSVEELNCKQPSTSTYVDDWIISIREIMNRSLQQGIDTTMASLKDYMAANKLVINKDKTLLMVISKNSLKQDQAIIPHIDPELVVTPKQHMKILGTYISNNLKWNYNLADAKDSLISQLQNKVNNATPPL